MARVPSILRLEEPGPIERLYQVLGRPDRDIAQIEEALRLIATVTCASTAYVEIFGDHVPARSLAYDVEARADDAIRASVTRDVVTEAVTARRTLAFEWSSCGSMVACLCAPIGTGEVIGIVWLEIRDARFSELDRERAQLLAAWLAAHRPRRLHEETQQLWERRVDEALRHSSGNISEAARELDVSRSFVYSMIERLRARTRQS